MFIGHFAVGFAAKRLVPRASLGALLAAPLLLDLLWPIALLAGIESVYIRVGDTVVTPLDLRDYPWTHSLAMAVAWSAVFGGGYFALARDRRAALVLALGVFSHWVLDFVTHRPDLPLWPGSAVYVGLGLWNSLAGTMVVEVALFSAGVWLYLGATRPRNRTGTVTFWAMIALVSLLYLAALFGPPPPSPKAIAVAGLASWLFVVWAWWIDRNRASTVS